MLKQITESIHWKTSKSDKVVLLIDESIAEAVKWNFELKTQHCTNSLTLSLENILKDDRSISLLSQFPSDKVLVVTTSVEMHIVNILKAVFKVLNAVECYILTTMTVDAAALFYDPVSVTPFEQIKDLLRPTLISIHYFPYHTLQLLVEQSDLPVSPSMELPLDIYLTFSINIA